MEVARVHVSSDFREGRILVNLTFITCLVLNSVYNVLYFLAFEDC